MKLPLSHTCRLDHVKLLKTLTFDNRLMGVLGS